MGSTSSGTETTTQKSEPWAQAQPYLTDIFSQSKNLYNQGQEYYPGSTVVPFHGDTLSGMSGLKNQFQQSPLGLSQATGAVTAATDAQGAGANPFSQQIQNAGGQQTTAGINTLNQFAGGGENPYLDKMFNKSAEMVRDNTQAAFSKAGRYGSTANQETLQNGMNDLATNIYGGAYESDQNRRMGAAQQLGQTQQNDFNRQLGALGTLGGYANQASDRSLQAASMMPGLNDYAQSGNRGLMELGGYKEQMAGQQLQDSMDRWEFGQNAGWDQLNKYNQTVQPIAGLGGTTTGTSPKSKQSPLQTVAGLGMGAMGIFSDRRLKTDIRKLGTRNGFGWYSYRYIWDVPGTVHEGVMAQDVLPVRPDAVMVSENGYLRVNYDALGLVPVFYERGLVK